MTLTTYTNWIFFVGILTGIALALVVRGVVEQVSIARYLRQRRRHPPAEPRQLR